MADPTFDVEFAAKGGLKKQIPFTIKDSTQLYVRQLVLLVSGYLDKHAAGSGTVCVGVVVGPGVPGNNPVMDGFTLTTLPIPMIGKGNASTAAAGNANKAVVETGEFTWDRLTLAVAGTLAGTIADVGTLLYAGAGSSNIADLSTTQTSTDKPIGVITAFYSKSGSNATYDVLQFSYEARKGM